MKQLCILILFLVTLSACFKSSDPKPPTEGSDPGVLFSDDTLPTHFKSSSGAFYQVVGGSDATEPDPAKSMVSIPGSTTRGLIRSDIGQSCGLTANTGGGILACKIGQVCVIVPPSANGTCSWAVIRIEMNEDGLTNGSCGCNGSVCVRCPNGYVCSGKGGDAGQGSCCKRGAPDCLSCNLQSGADHCKL